MSVNRKRKNRIDVRTVVIAGPRANPLDKLFDREKVETKKARILPVVTRGDVAYSEFVAEIAAKRQERKPTLTMNWKKQARNSARA
jgi:hypothetical protein